MDAAHRSIEVRRPSFDLAELPRHWFGGDPFRTHFMNALSSVFPDGEAWFVRSVLHYRDQVQDPELRQEIRAFAGQEGQHSHQHGLHCALLEAQGYTAIGRMNRLMRRLMVWLNEKAPLRCLANTAALEHLTALMARQVMLRPDAWTGEMDPRMAPLWQWHALEEAEHKAVAFDVLRAVHAGNRIRVTAQLLSTWGLFVETWLRMATMLHHDGLLWRPRLWLDGVRWLFGTGGILRGTGRHYRAWFRRDFHPSQIDDSALIEAWRDRVAA
jgi:predicted metal-dependent hydrolase